MGQVADQGVGEHRLPVLVQVLPEPELGELQDRERGALFDPVGQAALGDGDTNGAEGGVEVDARLVQHRLGEPRDSHALVHLTELLEQTVVRRAGAALVRFEPIGLLPRVGDEPYGHQDQRRTELAPLELPDQRSQGQVKVVRAGLLDDGARLVGQRPQPWLVSQARDVGVQSGLGLEQLGEQRWCQVATGAHPPGGMDVVQLITRQQGDRAFVVQSVLERAEASLWHREGNAVSRGEVDQPVAQAEVEQRVLPLLNPWWHRLLGDGGLHRAGRPRGGRCAVLGRPVLDHLHDSVGGAGLRRQRDDAVAAGGPDVHDPVHAVEVARQVGEVRRSMRGLERCRRVCDGHHRGLHQPNQPEVDVVHHIRHVQGRDSVQGALLAPVTDERMPLHHPQQRSDARLLECGGHHEHRVQAGTDPAVENFGRGTDFLADVRPAGRWFAVADSPGGHGVVDGTSDLIDAFGAGLVALDRWAARALLE